MKKILALVAVVALVAFAAPAFANVNPFMDVPMNHWAYDAIGQLAARGVLSGYPDGTYKGNQPMTRYEAASAIARALAVVDMTKASKQDVEMLKRLVVEFKDELDALGVKVDKIDTRLAQLESDIGGWKLTGQFRFDSRFSDQEQSALYEVENKVDQNTTRIRLNLLKRLANGVSFFGRFQGAGGGTSTWIRAYIDAALPWDINLRAGRQAVDWAADVYWAPFGTWQTDGLLTDRDGLEAFYFTKNFAMGEFGIYASRADNGSETDNNGNPVAGVDGDEHWEFAARAVFNFNEQFSLKLGYQMIDFQNDQVAGVVANDASFGTWYVEPKVIFTPNFILKGAYYSQNSNSADSGNVDAGAFNDPKAWRAIFEVKQEALKFTSLWLEYNQIDAGFVTPNSAAFGFIADVSKYAPLYQDYRNGGFGQIQQNTDILRIGAFQKWSDQWETFVHYAKFSIDGFNGGFSNDATNYSLGVNYNYTPALTFALAYDAWDAENDALDDHVIHFRTMVNF